MGLRKIILLLGAALLVFMGAHLLVGDRWTRAGAADEERPWERQKRLRQDRIGGVPEGILALQSLEKVEVASKDEATDRALEAARKAALPLIDTKFHTGRRLAVPTDFRTIQAALNAAKSGDTVLVRAGTYHELLVMKDGVKLVSDSSEGGDELAEVQGARLRLPRRTLRTIIDGSRAKPSRHGLIDFDPGVGRKTIVDGFTLQNLPKQDHHVPGHAHGLNIRGASPVITNCLIRRNGSTGLGNHVVYADQESSIGDRDFRWANVKHQSSAVIFGNVIHGNLGLGIGCNHFSTPWILGNDVFGNDDSELGDHPSPGMGVKHGAAPTVIGNIVHDNPGGGILCKVGARQGRHPIDRPTHPTLRRNVVYASGKLRPGIACDGAGSNEMPVGISSNFVYAAGAVGIGVLGKGVAVVEDNLVVGSALPGISVNGATALKLNRNRVTRAGAAGFAIVSGARVLEMLGNAADSNQGPRFLLRDSTIAGPSAK
jgi:hypothetical protein